MTLRWCICCSKEKPEHGFKQRRNHWRCGDCTNRVHTFKNNKRRKQENINRLIRE